MNFEALKNFMDRLSSWRIPGNSISVCVGGKEVFSYQSGYENYENKTPMTPGKLFNIFSCSKPITVTAALQLYEKGFFLLDDPLYDFIPEYKDMYIKNADGSITVIFSQCRQASAMILAYPALRKQESRQTAK